MAKKLIAPKDLELIVLQEIRSRPGCEDVTDVTVSRITDARFETNWSVIAITRDGRQSDMVRHATELAQEKLREIYNLFADRRTSPSC